MKGIIFTMVEEAVVAEHGEVVWDELLVRAGVSGAWTALGDYPVSELTALVDAGAEALDTPPDDLLRHLGHAALLGLADRYPHFFSPHDSVRPFLLTLDDVIHREVRKLHTDASPPDFWFDGDDPRSLVIHYRSGRRLCVMAEGMIAGAATHYGQRAEVEQLQCMLEGAEHCTMTATFADA